jgi:hypothetical protein
MILHVATNTNFRKGLFCIDFTFAVTRWIRRKSTTEYMGMNYGICLQQGFPKHLVKARNSRGWAIHRVTENGGNREAEIIILKQGWSFSSAPKYTADSIRPVTGTLHI